MLPLSHLGIGSKLVSPWTRELPKGLLLLGTLVPDLIDKPLYYSLVALTGRQSLDIGLISSTRTVGHTAILLLIVTSIAVVRRSRGWAALALGMATHLLLDNLSDSLAVLSGEPYRAWNERSALVALLFPVLSARFSPMPFSDANDHARHWLNPLWLGFEVVGGAILFWDWWKNRHESEIMQLLQIRRHLRKERRHRSRRKPVAET